MKKILVIILKYYLKKGLIKSVFITFKEGEIYRKLEL